MKENIRENSRISSFAKHWQRVFFEANLKLLKERKHLQNSNLFSGLASQVFENLKILKQCEERKCQKREKFNYLKYSKIPFFASVSQIWKSSWTSTRGKRKIRKLLGGKGVGRRKCTQRLNLNRTCLEREGWSLDGKHHPLWTDRDHRQEFLFFHEKGSSRFSLT